MFNSWTFGRRLAVGFGLAALVLLAMGVVGNRTTASLIANDGQVTHSYQVDNGLDDLLSSLKDAETGQRGYVITGDESYLAPYQKALTDIPTELQSLRQLTAGNASQQQRLNDLGSLIDTKLVQLKRAIDVRRSSGLDAAVKTLESSDGKATMDQIRSLVSQATAEDQQLLRQRTQRVQATANLATAVTLWGGVSGAVLVGLIGWLIIRSLTGQIGEAVSQMRSSSTELQAAATQQATGAKEQSTATSEITTTISELLVTSRQIAESAQQVAQMADQTSRAASSGSDLLDKTRDAMSSIRRQVDQIVTDMLDLGKKSQEIGAVLDIVSELAEQTNILAINATIEAAGAGETGLRFGVVADEIRKLADRVGSSTKEIRALIDSVRSATNTTVMATESGSKAVEAGVRQFDQVSASFSHITSLVGVTTEAAREIELSTKQQTSAVEQVNMAIANVAQASKETEVSSAQTLQTASQLTGLSKDLTRIVQSEPA